MSRYLRVAITLLVFLFISPVGASAQDSAPVPPEEARVRDASEYAKAYGVELDEALRRLALQDPIGDLHYQLRTNEAETFAGLWIQHSPAFKVIVKFTGKGQEVIQPYIENSMVADLVEVRTATVSLAELEAIQETAMELVRPLDIPVDSAINVGNEQVELYVVERQKFDTELQRLDIQLIARVEVVTVNQLARPATNIYGGLALSVCTSGFAVQHYERKLGITTAGHCGGYPPAPENPIFYSGTQLPLQEQLTLGNADIQWHTAPGFKVRSWINDGFGNRLITATKDRAYQSLNEWVCHYGRVTLHGCGEIVNLSYQSTWIPGATATYIRVSSPSGANLAEPGDSGGPWFYGGTAYGTMVSHLGNDAIYMAINYIDALNFNVYTGKETYLPDVRNNSGWLSTITVRNDGTSGRRVTIIYLDNAGNYIANSRDICFLSPNATCSHTPPTGFEGSAIVDGSDDLSVAVETIYSQSGRFLADMYPGVTSSRIGTTMYAPLILRNWLHLNSSWRQTTNLYIHNPSPQSASVTVTFYDSYGTTGSSHAESRTIPAGGSVTIAGTVLPIWEGGSINGSLASARITSNVPVAVVVRNLVGTSNNGVITTPYLSASYRGFAASEAGSILYYPLAANQWVGAYDSGFQIQNISSSPKTVTVRFYKEGDPNPQGSAVNLNIGAYQSANVWRPSGLPQLYGSAIAEVSGGGNDIVAVAQYEDTRISQSKYGLTLYEAVSNNNRSLVVPRFRRTSPWDWTGVIAQNMSGATNGVTLAFYNMSGSLNTSQSKNGVLNRTSTLFFNEIPTIDGSAQVASTYPFGLMVNVSRRDLYTNQDIMMGYSIVK